VGNDLNPIVSEIADRADNVLAGATNRAQARAGISELITVDYGFLTPPERKEVTDAVMAILEHEDFFGTEYVGDPFADEEGEE
jgi:hypothetical protein